ncbi:putative ribonuclease H-like domain-containing protein [Tanacetum coccineum]|uniref:Ribonuclease H-like domain-containing protein n=1 Tax=Tanacetum coccineum TaxID=301880 RepID=A0ABQ5E0M0_9ASTR
MFDSLTISYELLLQLSQEKQTNGIAGTRDYILTERFWMKPTEDDVSGALDKDGRMIQVTRSEMWVQDADLNNLETTINVSPIPTTRIDKDHPKDQIIGDFNSAIQTRRMTKISDEHAMVCYINKQRRTNHKDYQNCLFACFLSQMEPKKVIQALEDPSWIEAMQEELLQFQLQKDERGIVVRNKARLVAQGYTQEEGIDYDEVFAHVARIEAIRLFLAYASFMGFIVYQMDVKSAFLYGTIEEEKYLCDEFEQMMHKKFQMSSMGELTLFLGLQVQQNKDGIFISQDKYVADILKKFDFATMKTISTPMESNKELIKDEEADTLNIRNHNRRIVNFMPRIDFMAMLKHTLFQILIFTEARYVATANCCRHVLWIQNQMLDYGFNFMNTKIFIDNESTICIVKNLVFHSKTKHIEIRHHFIRDCYENKLIQVIKIRTDHNVADLLTKAFDVSSTAGLSLYCWMKLCIKVDAARLSPTINASYIEQFWNTATSKIVNSVKQIHAIVHGKAVVISESSVRSDLIFNDEDSIAYLTNDEIFKNLALMGYEQLSTKLTFKKGKVTLLFDSMLVQNQAPEGEGSTIPPEPQPTPSTSQLNVSEPQTKSLQTETPLTVSHALQTEAHIEQILPSPSTYQRKQRKTQKHRRAKQVTALPQTSVPLDYRADEAVHKEGVIEIGSGDRPRHQDTILGGADAQTRHETASKTSRDPPLSEVNTSGRGEDNMEYHDGLTDFVPPTPHDSPLSGGSKDCLRKSDHQIEIKGQEARKEEKGKNSTTYEEKDGRNDDKIEELNLTDRANTEVIVEDKGSGEKGGSTADQVSTGRPEVSAASVPVNVSAATPSTPPTTTTIFGDEDLTIAQTLVKIRSKKAKEKEKGVVLIDEEESPRLNRSTTTLQPLPTIDPKDKGKGVLVKEEPEKPVKVKRKDQGLAQIESDAELAQRLHEEELAKLDRAQKERQKQEEATSAALAEEFDEIQARIDADHELAVRLTHEEQEKYIIEERSRLLAEFFERRKKQLATERAEAIRNKPPTRTQVRNKMVTYLKHIDSKEESSKKQKLEEDNDAEKEELRDSMDVVPRDDVAIDVESLATKYPIVD